MTTALSPILASRLEKAASDNGFDRALEREGSWLVFASSLCPGRLWLGADGNAPVAAFSHLGLASGLEPFGRPATTLPSDATLGRAAKDFPELHRLLRRAFELAQAPAEEPPEVVQNEPKSQEDGKSAATSVLAQLQSETWTERCLKRSAFSRPGPPPSWR